jgi:hypothetical protein
MKNLKNHKVWEINEFFHNGLSHTLLMVPSAFLIAAFAFFEINHPTVIPLNNIEIVMLLFSGVVTGIIFAFASKEGSVGNLMFYVCYLVSMAIPFSFIRFNLDFRFYPANTFVEILFIVSVITLGFYKKKGFVELVPHLFFDE